MVDRNNLLSEIAAAHNMGYPVEDQITRNGWLEKILTITDPSATDIPQNRNDLLDRILSAIEAY